MAHVEKRGPNRWRARYRGPDGRERSKTFAKKVDAERWVRAREVSKDTGDWIDPRLGRRLFVEWVKEYESTITGLRPSTLARDDSYMRNHVIPTFGRTQLGAIDAMSVRTWIAKLEAKGLAPATVQKCHQVLSKAMQAAVAVELIKSNPCASTPLPKVEREEMRFLIPAEVATLADAIDKRYRSLVLVGAYGGLRAGELFGLRHKRLDLMRGRVDVAEILVEVRGHHHVGPPKTRAGRRSVPLPRFVVDELMAHVAPLQPEELVFPAPEGGPVRASLWRRRVWEPACVAAGVGRWWHADADKMQRLVETGRRVGRGWHYEGLRLHDLRHTAVALWIAAGATPNEIAKRAGHTSVVTVLDRYGHLLPELEDRVTEALDALGSSGAPRRGSLHAIG